MYLNGQYARNEGEKNKIMNNYVCKDPLPPSKKEDNYLIHRLSTEFAFGSLSDMRFWLEPLPPPPPKKRDNISLSEPKANSEERWQVLIYLSSNLGRDWVGGVEKFHL